MKNNRTYFGVKYRSIFIAATFSMILDYVMGLSDKIIVGNILGDVALSSLTLIDPLFLMIAFAGMVLAAGAGMHVSAALGKGDQALADKQFSQAVILALGIGVIITAACLVFSRQIVDALAGHGPEARYASDFFCFMVYQPVPLLLTSVLYPVVLYRGGEKYCSVAALITVLGKIGLSLTFVFGMGMKGVSLANVLSACAGLVPLILFMFTEKGRMKLSFYLSLTDIRGMGVFSVGSAIIYLYMGIFQACMNIFLLSYFDGAAIIVFTGVVNLSGLFAVLSDAVGEPLLSLINMYRGENNVLGEKKTVHTTLKLSVVEGMTVMLVMLVFVAVMPTLFGVDDVSVRGDFVRAARIYALSAPFFFILNTYVKYYLYIGKFRNSILLSLCLNLIFPLIFGLWGGLALGMTGVWLGMALGLLVLQVCAYLILRRQEGADGLCLFLDYEAMSRQHCWDVEMSEKGIAYLMDNAEQLMMEKGVSRSRINKVLLAIEETQMDDLLKNKDVSKVRIECTLFLDEKISLVLHNSGVIHNAVENCLEPIEDRQTRYHILASMQNKEYILVNGSNRLVFEF